MVNLQPKVILLTGAASGIGRECALGLASMGAIICAADVDAEGARDTASAITANGGEALGLPLDVTSEESWHQVIEQLKLEFGGLQVLVNNAGVILSRPILLF